MFGVGVFMSTRRFNHVDRWSVSIHFLKRIFDFGLVRLIVITDFCSHWLTGRDDFDRFLVCLPPLGLEAER